MSEQRAIHGLALAIPAAAAVTLGQLSVEVAAGPPDLGQAGLAAAGVIVLASLLGSLAFLIARLLAGGRWSLRAVALVAVGYLGLLQVVLAVPWGGAGARGALAWAAVLAVGLAYLALRGKLAGLAWMLRVPLWVGLDLILVAVILGLSASRERPVQGLASGAGGRPSVLLVSIDTLRADFVGAYGRAAARTPVLDGLAAEGVRFTDAICPAVITGPSHASLLTGLLPTSHGVHRNLVPLAGSIPTLAEVFGQAGFETGAFVGGYPLKQESLGVLERFGTHDEQFHPAEALPPAFFRTPVVRALEEGLRLLGLDLHPHHRPANEVTDAATAWLQSSAEPFFCFVHYFDPHLPFEAPAEYLGLDARAWAGPGRGRWHQASIEERVDIIRTPGAIEQMDRLYDAEIAFVDHELERLVASARARAGGGGLWIVVSSDHGESHGERDHYFERTLYDDTLRVPLIVVPPAGASPGGGPGGRVIGGQVRTVDIAPTLLAACALEGPQPMDGSSLLDSLAPGAPPPDRLSLTADLSTSRVGLAVRVPGWKAIWREGYWDRNAYAWDPEEHELYDLVADPGEVADRSRELPDRWEALSESFELLRAANLGLPAEDLEPQQLRALRALGYAH